MPDTFRTTIGRIKTKDSRHSDSRHFDGLANFEARLGLGTDNQMSASTYTMLPLTRNRAELDNMYRGSWIVRQVVGVIPDDMTRGGIEFTGEEDQDKTVKLTNTLRRQNFWRDLARAAKWGRLYGGAIAIIMVEGQKLNDPLRPETVGRGQLKGLTVIDRWSLQPSNQLVTELGPDFGKPVSYDVISGMNTGQVVGNIHHTRVIRFEGEDLPYYQRTYEMGWGMSVIEPLQDRLIAFDTTTLGAAQMVYRAHLRVLKMQDLRKNIALGGAPFEAAMTQVDMMRRYQSIEGLSLIDSQDEFTATTYAFGGLSDILIQMSQQLAGACDIPVVKLFGMSPAGFSSGDADLKNYYDNVALQRERDLRRPIEVYISMLYRSELGAEPGAKFGFEFAPLYELSATEKATIATQMTTSITGPVSLGIVKQSTGLRELQKTSQVTGLWTTISDKDIEDAEKQENEPDLPPLPQPSSGEESETEAISDPNSRPQEDNVEEPFDVTPFPLRRAAS